MEEIRDYYKNTRNCINEYNEIQYQIRNSVDEITDEESEKLDHHWLYLAHALLKDVGSGAESRQGLSKMCDVIKTMMKGDSYEF